ncbi:hypothetical protein pb186bvf_008027 [Paramecium bursaria]
MDSILICVSGLGTDMRVSYPDNGVVQMNYSQLNELNFTSYNQQGQVISYFEVDNIIAIKIQTQEAIIQMDAIKLQFTLQCIVIPDEESILVSINNQNVITVHSLDKMLCTFKPDLETIPEEREEISQQDISKRINNYQSPHKKKETQSRTQRKRKPIDHNDKENKQQINQKKFSPYRQKQSLSPKRTPPKKSPLKETNLKKSGNKFSPIKKSPQKKSPGKYSKKPIERKKIKSMSGENNPVDVLLAQLISQNNKKKRPKKFAIRPKMDSEGIIDRQWLEEELINEDL